MERPPHLGLHHLALRTRDLEAMERFYTDLLGFHVEWRPDADTIYLTSGSDNLALHRSETAEPASVPGGRLDHLGLLLETAEDVDRWHIYLARKGVKITALPRTHRDGARSFYCEDPEGNGVQLIHHPPLARPPAVAPGQQVR